MTIQIGDDQDNRLEGDEDNDTLIGNDGDDTLIGGAGDDSLIGGAGDDELLGGAGENTLVGGAGNDLFEGSGDHGDPFDFVNYWQEDGSFGVVVDLKAGTGTDTYGDHDTYIGIEAVLGSKHNDVMMGSDLKDEFAGFAGDDTLDGGLGNDEIRYNYDVLVGGTSGVYVNLAEGYAIDGFGDRDELRNFEIVRGTIFNDTLIGDDNINWLRGLAGNDTLDGRGGNDYADYSKDVNGGGLNGVVVNLDLGVALDGYGDQDTLISIEGVIGTRFDDSLTGDENDNHLNGASGDDIIFASGGNDRIDGGNDPDSFDLLSYQHSAQAGIHVTFSSDNPNQGQVDKGSGTDLFTGIDGVHGTAFDDVFVGGGGMQRFSGFGGNDIFDGSLGINEVDYREEARKSGFTGGLRIDLGGGTVIDPTGDTDTLIAIERVRGTDGNDTLIGDGADNRLRGGSGDDTLTGGAGDDDIRGEAGVDMVTFRGASSDYIINYLGNSTYSLTDKVDGRDGSDLVSEVEYFEFANGTFYAEDLLRPGKLNLSSAVVNENSAAGKVIGHLSAFDPNGDALTYRLLDNAGGRFDIQGEALVVRNGGLLDYEQARSHVVTIRVQDSSLNFRDQTFVIGVKDIAVEVVSGTSGHDRTFGGRLNDRLGGGAGNDLLKGMAGNDRLDGGIGNDRLFGGLGNDILKGGKGKDNFVFDTKPNKKNNLDQIKDFNVKDDSIWLDNAIFKKLGKAGTESKPAKLNKKFFKIGSKSADRDDYLIYNNKKGILYYDADGSGKGKAIEIAKLAKNLKLTVNDFFVI